MDSMVGYAKKKGVDWPLFQDLDGKIPAVNVGDVAMLCKSPGFAKWDLIQPDCDKAPIYLGDGKLDLTNGRFWVIRKNLDAQSAPVPLPAQPVVKRKAWLVIAWRKIRSAIAR